MKMTLFAFCLTTLSLTAQVVVPTTPTRFGKRQIGGGAGNGTAEVNATIAPKESTARVVSYFAMEAPRQWKSTDGKSLLGSLIAFEESVVVVTGANAAAAASSAQSSTAPKPPEKFTIIRDGKVRLLVNQKPFEIPLDRLAEEDRLHVTHLDKAITKKEAAK
jgi:hypothetical protein